LWIFESFAAGAAPLQQPPAVQPQEEVVQGMIWWAFAFATTLLPSLLLLCRYAQLLCSTTLHSRIPFAFTDIIFADLRELVVQVRSKLTAKAREQSSASDDVLSALDTELSVDSLQKLRDYLQVQVEKSLASIETTGFRVQLQIALKRFTKEEEKQEGIHT
jgi:hypothetical protein